MSFHILTELQNQFFIGVFEILSENIRWTCLYVILHLIIRKLKNPKMVNFEVLTNKNIFLDGKVQAMRIFSKKNLFRVFFTSSDRTWAADREKLLFSLSRCFFPVEKHEILRRCRFSRKTHYFSKCANFLLYSFFLLLKIIFPIQDQKLSRNKLINRLKTQNPTSGGASNRIECTAYRSILYNYLVFLRKW